MLLNLIIFAGLRLLPLALHLALLRVLLAAFSHLSLTFFSFKIDVLLLNVLLQVVDLLAVHFNPHLVGSCNQVWVDLHVHFSVTLLSITFHFLLVRVTLILLVQLFVSRHPMLEFLLVDVIFFVVHTTVILVAVLFCLANHALSMQLLFPHLVELVFLVVPVRHDPCNCRFVVSLACRLVLRVAFLVVNMPAVQLLLLVDFFRSSDCIF